MFVLPSLGGGGAARVVVTLLRHLDRRRFEPHLAVVGALWPYLRDVPDDVGVHALTAGRVRRAVPKLLAVIRRLQPAVVVSTQGYMNFVLLVMRPLFPRSKLVVREVIGEQYLENSRFRHQFYRLYLRVVRHADRVVTQSDAVRSELTTRLRAPSGQVVRLHNPIDAARLAAEARSSATPYVGAGPHLLAAGRLHPQKGFDLLLESFGGAVADGVSGGLTILGEGEERSALEAQVHRLGLTQRVRFMGFQEHPYPYFGHADLFVLSSRYEGMPNVVLEALACSCPVVAFNCPHGVDEIVRNEVNGLLLPPEDVAGLRYALSRLLGSQEERERLRSQIAPTLAPFLAGAVAGAWEDLFEELTAV